MKCRHCLALTIVAVSSALASQALQADQLTTLTVDGLPKSATTSQFVSVNRLLFFAVQLADSGAELWRSDGTSAGTFRIQNG